MDQKLQAYYESLFDMFQSEGWKNYQEDAQRIFDQKQQTWDQVRDEKEFFTLKGEMKDLRWTLGFQDMIEAAYKNFMREDDDARL